MRTEPRRLPAVCRVGGHPARMPPHHPRQAMQGTLAACARRWPPQWGVYCPWRSYREGLARTTVAHSTSVRS
eukprot:6486483-Amphidinium_carterae.2